MTKTQTTLTASNIAEQDRHAQELWEKSGTVTHDYLLSTLGDQSVLVSPGVAVPSFEEPRERGAAAVPKRDK